MRILYLTNGFPYPLTSGYLRHYYLIRELSRYHAVTLLSIVGPHFLPEHAQALAPYTDHILTFQSTSQGRSPARKALGRIQAVAGGLPSDGAVRQMRAAAERLAQADRYHVALLSGKQTFPAIEGLRDLPLAVDMCDATSIQIQGRMRHARPARRMILGWDYLQVRRIEQNLIRRAAHVLFASQRDLEALRMETGRRASVIPNGINLEYWRRSASQRGQATVVFTGGMHYPPNTDAALYLIEEIFPQVQRVMPAARLFIVGRDPTPRLVLAGQRPGVTVTGFVEDVRPYLDQATVFAAPLRFGAGIQNKVLEAMAMEVPVVASPVAADGLRTEAGQLPPLRVASDRSGFAQEILTALQQAERDASSCSEGRRFVATHFEWECSGKKLSRVFEQVAAGGKERE